MYTASETAMAFFFKQKTAYEISTRDWSSDVCSSDLPGKRRRLARPQRRRMAAQSRQRRPAPRRRSPRSLAGARHRGGGGALSPRRLRHRARRDGDREGRPAIPPCRAPLYRPMTRQCRQIAPQKPLSRLAKVRQLARSTLALALAAAAALALVSCGGGDDAKLLPGNTAQEITENLDRVQQ